MTSFAFTIPALPDRLLSSNAGGRSRRNPWAVAEAKGVLKNNTMEAMKDHQPIPAFARCTVTVTLYHSNKRPKVEECPRCLIEALNGGDAACCCYRPSDVGNIGGDVLKPILDGMTWMEMVTDDDYTHVEAVTLRIGRVATVAEERIEVYVEGEPVA